MAAVLLPAARGMLDTSAFNPALRITAPGQFLPASEDTFVDLNAPDHNFDCTGSPPKGLELLYSNFPGFVSTREAYLQFDLSGVSGPAELSSLSVHIVQNALPGSAMVNLSLYATSDDAWNETTLTYNNQPAAPTLTHLQTVTVTSIVTGELIFDDPQVGQTIETERQTDQTASFLLRLTGGTDLEFGGGLSFEDREGCHGDPGADEPVIKLQSAMPPDQTIYLPLIRKEAP